MNTQQINLNCEIIVATNDENIRKINLLVKKKTYRMKTLERK